MLIEPANSIDVRIGTDHRTGSNYPSGMRYLVLILISGIALAACGTAREATRIINSELSQPESGQGAITPDEQSQSSNPQSPTEPATGPTVAADLINPRNYNFESYLPPQLIGPDGIRPIYEPRFVEAVDAPLNDDELIIGVALEGEAKAYPITVLRFREMVNDELGELPILVTW